MKPEPATPEAILLTAMTGLAAMLVGLLLYANWGEICAVFAAALKR